MYEKNGEKYFVVDSHIHYWDASPAELGGGPGAVRQGLDRVLPRLPVGLAPAETHWTLEKFQKYSEDDLMKDVFEDGHVDVGHLPAHVPEAVVHGRLQHDRAQRRAGREAPRQVHRQHPVATRARVTPGLEAAGGERRALVRLEGRQALHRGVDRRLARLEADATRRRTGTSTSARSSASRTSTSTRARRSGRSTRTRSTCPTSTTRRPTSRTSTSSSSTSACRGSRTSASWRRRSPTSTPVCPWSSAG